jgi:5'-phosphate synthase pdxT subunit
MGIGVLALQGDWLAHQRVLRELGVESAPVRTAADLRTVESIVIPGGESSAMLRLMRPEGLDKDLVARIRRGMPVLAVCAGVILLARGVEPEQPRLGMLDVDLVRNAYGRQVHSRVTTIAVEDEMGEPAEMEAMFIRAPRIIRTGVQVRVLGRCNGDAVLVRQERMLAATFHPELGVDRRVHRLFCDLTEVSNG